MMEDSEQIVEFIFRKMRNKNRDVKRTHVAATTEDIYFYKPSHLSFSE